MYHDNTIIMENMDICKHCRHYKPISVTNGYCPIINMYISPTFKRCEIAMKKYIGN